MLDKPFYNPDKSYDENWEEGPFNDFSNSHIHIEEGEPKYNIFGYAVFKPFGIPAGPLLNGKFVRAALDKGFDVPMHKTVRTRPYESHPWPNVLAVSVEGDLTLDKAQKPIVAHRNYRHPLSITNSFGNPSRHPDVWQNDIADSVAHAKKGQIVTASIEGTRWEGTSEEDYIKDWVLGARLLKEAGTQVIEANLSCPNEGAASLLCFDIPKAKRIAEAMKNEIGDAPLALKTAYFENQEQLRQFVKEVGNIVDGIASINTISAEVVDEKGNQALPGEKRKRSGICGHSIKWAGLDMVRRLKELRSEFGYNFQIVGVGGVTKPEDYKEYREAGADIVMSATGAMWNPRLAIEIKQKYQNL